MIHFSRNLTINYENITQKAAVTNIQHGKTHEIHCIASQIITCTSFSSPKNIYKGQKIWQNTINKVKKQKEEA